MALTSFRPTKRQQARRFLMSIYMSSRATQVTRCACNLVMARSRWTRRNSNVWRPVSEAACADKEGPPDNKKAAVRRRQRPWGERSIIEALARQHAQRVNRVAVAVELEVQVRAGRAPGTAHPPDDLALRHGLARPHQDR